VADVTCPRCGAAMRERKGSRGVFLSCSTYPACKGTRDIGGAAPAGPPRVAPPPVIGVPPGAQPIWHVPPSTSVLDSYQQAVADWREGFSVVAASAGSGKTHTAVQRTLSLLRESVVPESICILVYNRDAAEMLRNRLSDVAGPQAKRVQVFTFHAWCYALLRHWYPTDPRLAVGRIIGTSEAPHVAKLVAPLISELRLDDDMEWGPASMCSERITEALVDLSGPAAAEALSRAMGWCAKGAEFTAGHQKQAEPFVTFCRAWRDRKRRDNYIEFCDMLAEVARAIQTAADAPHVAHLAQMYRHVMVDEAQDISLPRAVIATHLAKGARSSLWVGDARQSIYLFTGARPDILLNAVAEGATLHTLPVNRRSTKRIVAAANAICRGHEWHVGGDCLARPDAPLGELVQVHVDADPSAEAARIIEDISRRVAAGRPLGTVAEPNYCLLARTNAMLVDLECAFVARNIPVRVHGCPGGLWGTSVGQQLLAYLEAIEGVPSWGLMAVMNKPKRYCTRADVEAAITAGQAREKAGQPADLFRALKASKGRGAQRLGDDLAKAAGKPWQVRCLQASKWLGVDDEDAKVSGGEDRKAALTALVELAQQLGSLRAIYAYKVAATKGEQVPSVLLSTIHSQKGQEHPVVYVCGVRSRKLPHERCEDEEEERRLFYVACTRARDVLQIGTGGVPSRFLIELGWATAEEGSMLTDAV
jgi:DNA helicase-2/ATP-dependent DNA helicase PcrA